MDKDIQTKLKISNNPNGDIKYTKLDENYFILTNTSSADKFDKIKQILTILAYENELTIKYADEKISYS